MYERGNRAKGIRLSVCVYDIIAICGIKSSKTWSIRGNQHQQKFDRFFGGEKFPAQNHFRRGATCDGFAPLNIFYYRPGVTHVNSIAIQTHLDALGSLFSPPQQTRHTFHHSPFSFLKTPATTSYHLNHTINTHF